jgi:hypothetical protein
MQITEEEKGILLLAARESIKSIFGEKKSPKVDYGLYPNLKHNLGAFVTLTIDEKLRGCIGYILAQRALFETICEAARQAAFYDPRFLPLTADELDEIDIEISILSLPIKIDSYKDIILGVHGLLLDEENYRAVLLPQVATSNNYTLQQFLSVLCEKAGMMPDSWCNRNLNLKVFTADIFSEKELKSKKYETG